MGNCEKYQGFIAFFPEHYHILCIKWFLLWKTCNFYAIFKIYFYNEAFLKKWPKQNCTFTRQMGNGTQGSWVDLCFWVMSNWWVGLFSFLPQWVHPALAQGALWPVSIALYWSRLGEGNFVQCRCPLRWAGKWNLYKNFGRPQVFLFFVYKFKLFSHLYRQKWRFFREKNVFYVKISKCFKSLQLRC